MKREVLNFKFMDIKQQFVFLMINEDINIISFISDIVFENIQMREKMVWYVESPIVLRCTLFALIYIYICIMFLLFAKLGGNSNTVQSELSPIVQWMELGLSQNHFQYCVLPYIFFNIIDYCLLHY